MRHRIDQLHAQMPPYLRGTEPELTIFRNAIGNVPFTDALLAPEAVSAEEWEQKLALCFQNMTEHLPIEPKEENDAAAVVNELAEVYPHMSPIIFASRLHATKCMLMSRDNTVKVLPLTLRRRQIQ